MKIRINKDFLKAYKEDAWKGFSGKELASLLFAAGMAIAFVVLLHRAAGVSPAAAVYAAVPISAPLVILGFYRYQGYLAPQRLLREILYTVSCRRLAFVSGEQIGGPRIFRLERKILRNLCIGYPKM